MTREEKIASIVSLIQNDTKLLTLLRALVSKNIANVSDDQLDTALTVLNG